MSLLDLYRLLLKECERSDKRMYPCGICNAIVSLNGITANSRISLEADFKQNKPKYNKHTWFWLLSLIPHAPNYWWTRGDVGSWIRISFVKHRIKQLEKQ